MTDDNRPEREQWLRRAVLAGDESAWRVWYDETFEPLYRYVLWRCGGRRDWTDEIVQEAWLTAVRRIDKFDPRRGAFADWLRGIAVNQLRNDARRRQRNNAQEYDDRAIAAPEAASSGMHYQPEVATALEALSERHEAVLRAKYLDQRSVAEIAVQWNETPKAVESLLTRARQAFRQVYERLMQQDRT